MVENPVNGEYYWTISYTLAEWAIGDYPLHRPWRGKYQREGEYRGQLQARGYEDMSTTALVSNDQIFATQKEAMAAYREELQELINRKERELIVLVGELSTAHITTGGLKPAKRTLSQNERYKLKRMYRGGLLK
jgi:hypothetical protein